MDRELIQWRMERDQAIYSFDIETFKAFYRKWVERGIYEDKPLPSDEVLEIAIRKMVCSLENPRADKFAEAAMWLAQRGHSRDI